ncbi:methionine ABC transporter permease [Tenggerimyces flavus]|uniref:Methionine ABC transporter permease n=1 Tax=Tenggerimyces flavus TaxID=1708749 RepID=A0ABV7YG82_9ACTN|nr:methionine ABC transporter permease [Tenggerimyces flavus]MBM7787177.1 D-methionine transport system permease protein [Tenggerimyces flavus]
MNDWQSLVPELLDATVDTLYMVGLASVVTIVGGLPLGVLLLLTDKGGLLAAPKAQRVLGAVVNVGRSLPFIVLLVAVIPFTRLVVGTTIGSTAAIVPLSLGAIPFFARLVETSLRDVDRGLVEAALAMGARTRDVVGTVYLRETLPSLVSGLTITIVALIGYSAMAGVVGGGGLGDLAIRYGYQRFETDVMVATVVLLIVMVQLVQMAGDTIARRLDHR